MSYFCVRAKCVRIRRHARLRRDVVRAPRVSLRRKRVSSTHDEAGFEKIGLLQREKSRLARVAREESIVVVVIIIIIAKERKRRQRPIRFARLETTHIRRPQRRAGRRWIRPETVRREKRPQAPQ